MASDTNTQRQPSQSMVTRLRDSKTGKLSAPIGYVPRAGGGFTLGVGGAKNINAAKEAQRATEASRSQTTPSVVVPPTPSVSPGSLQIQVGTAMPQLPKIGNVIINTETVPVVDTQTKSRSLRNSLANAYTKVDTALGGYLPGSVTPTAVKTDRTVRKTSEQQALQAAQLAAQQQQDNFLLQKLANEVNTSTQESILKEQLDQSRTRGLERFGLFRSDEEKAVQEILSRQAYLQSLSSNIPAVQEAFLSAQNAAGGIEAFQAFNDSLQPKEEQGFFDKIGAGLTGAGIATVALVGLGIFLLAKNNK